LQQKLFLWEMVGNRLLMNILKVLSCTVVQNTFFGRHLEKNVNVLQSYKTNCNKNYFCGK